MTIHADFLGSRSTLTGPPSFLLHFHTHTSNTLVFRFLAQPQPLTADQPPTLRHTKKVQILLFFFFSSFVRLFIRRLVGLGLLRGKFHSLAAIPSHRQAALSAFFSIPIL